MRSSRQGKWLFAEGTVPTALRLVESATFTKGAVHLTYERAGQPTFALAFRSAAVASQHRMSLRPMAPESAIVGKTMWSAPIEVAQFGTARFRPAYGGANSPNVC